MSVFDPAYPANTGFKPGLRLSTRRLGNFFLGLAVFLIGFVFFEPAPYELLVVGLIVVWFVFGLTLHRAFLPLTFLMLIYMLGGMLAATQRADSIGAFQYIATTAFLSVTSIFFAALISRRPVERLNLIFKAYTAAAIISSIVAILAYFRLLPNSEMFLFGGRARGTFEDPNVFSPFLILAILYLARDTLIQPMHKSLGRLVGLLVLLLALFLAFSRAGWGLAVVTIGFLVLIVLATNRSGSIRARILLISLFMGFGGVAILTFILSFDIVSDLFAQRARLVQSYDSAQFGRFARYSYGITWIMEGPLGYGFGKFRETFGEDSHNVYLKAFIVHGWLGGLAYSTLVFTTLGLGFKHMFRPTPLQGYFQCVLVAILGHALVGLVVDTDRWRHVYLLYGLAWGMIAANTIWFSQTKRPQKNLRS